MVKYDDESFNRMRAATRLYPLLKDGEDPKIVFNPDTLKVDLQMLSDGELRAIILTDFVALSQQIGDGHIRLAEEIKEAADSLGEYYYINDQIFGDMNSENSLSNKFSLALKNIISSYSNILEKVSSSRGVMSDSYFQILTNFGGKRVVTTAPEMHTHNAGATHITFGDALLEIMIGDTKPEDAKELFELDSHVKSYEYMASRPDLENRIRLIPENALIIMGRDLYHRSPTSLLHEGNNRLALLTL